MKNLFAILLTAQILFFTNEAVRAQDTVYVPQDQPTIQMGIDAAINGNIVLVDTGTYNENINYNGKAITVASKYILNQDDFYRDNTTINGYNPTISASVVYFISGEDTTSILCGFTITGGKGTVTTDTVMIVEGGGIYIHNSGAKIIDNIIRDNIVTDTLLENIPGTVCRGGGISCYDENGTAWVVIEDNEIIQNTSISKYSQGIGGGFYTLSNVRIMNNSIENNYCRGVSDTTIIGGCGGTCLGNINFTPSVICKGNQFLSNTGEPNGGYAFGGGFESEMTVLDYSDNTLTGNKLIDIVFNRAYGGGFFCNNLAEGSQISNNFYSFNESDGYGGGAGISVFPGWNVFENNYFFHNSAKHGGALYTEFSKLIIQNNVYFRNEASGSAGAVFIKDNDVPTMPNCCILNCSFSENAGSNGGAVFANNASPIILNSIFWHDTANSPYEIKVNAFFLELAYTNIDTSLVWQPMELIIGDGMIDGEDPLFNDTLLHIPGGSPCINKGIGSYNSHNITWEAPLYDIDNFFRPDTASGLFDMGAHEFGSFGVGITESGVNSQQSVVSIFPNPSNQIFNLQFSTFNLQRVILKVFDLQGREVATVVDEVMQPGMHAVEFDASELPAGVYVWRKSAVSGQQSAVGKLIKF